MNAIQGGRKRNRLLGSDSPILPPLLTSIAVWFAFWLLVPQFGTIRTVSGVLSAASINAVVVIGVTLLMISGEVDLSVGSIMAMGGYIFAKTITGGGSPVTAIGMALLVSAVMGAINGIVTVNTQIPSFIFTLGTRSIYRGAVWLYSGGILIQTTQRMPIYDLLNGRLDILNRLFEQANFRTVTLWVLLLGVAFQLLLTRTPFGNRVFAVGGNSSAATAQGVNVKMVKVICFMITGVLSGLAGVLTFSQFLSIYVSTGSVVELTAIAGAVVGGSTFSGGIGSVIGGLLGILLIDTLRSGVILLGFPSDNFMMIVGAAIIGAAVLNERIRGRF